MSVNVSPRSETLAAPDAIDGARDGIIEKNEKAVTLVVL
jgi:hypothetical protein